MLKPQVDDSGYDLVLEANSIVRHVQLKSSFRGSTVNHTNVNVLLAGKPSGCVVFMWFDQETLDLGPFAFFGGAPRQKLPDISGMKVGRHTKGTETWAIDARSWLERLSTPFLQGLSLRAVNAFTDLVKAGCQPDILALHFHEATQVEEYSKDHDHIRTDLEELERLTAQAVSALELLANRRRQFDEYLHGRRLRVVYGEPGDAELKILFANLEDLAAEHQADYRSLRRKLDGRRQPLLGHAEIRLSRHIHEVTGAYHDKDVEDILDELRERLGQQGRVSGTLKRRRARWKQALQPVKNEG